MRKKRTVLSWQCPDCGASLSVKAVQPELKLREQIRLHRLEVHGKH